MIRRRSVHGGCRKPDSTGRELLAAAGQSCWPRQPGRHARLGAGRINPVFKLRDRPGPGALLRTKELLDSESDSDHVIRVGTLRQWWDGPLHRHGGPRPQRLHASAPTADAALPDGQRINVAETVTGSGPSESSESRAGIWNLALL